MTQLFSALKTAKNWSVTLGIFAIIGTVIFSLFLLVTVFFIGQTYGDAGGPAKLAVFISLLLIVIPLFFFSIFLMKYQSACGRALLSEKPQDILLSVKRQKAYLKFQGIISIILLIILLINVAESFFTHLKT